MLEMIPEFVIPLSVPLPEPVIFTGEKVRYDMLQHRMYGAGGFNRDDIANTVRTKVIDVFFKEHSRKPKRAAPLQARRPLG